MRASGKIKALALMAAMMIAPVAASAATMTLDRQDTTSFGPNGRQSIVIYDTTLLPAGRSVTAGAFALKATPVQSFTDAAGKFTAFCLDIVGQLHLPGLYNETLTPFTKAPLTALQKSNVRKLFNTAYSTLSLASDAQSAGFQLALWEIVNENSGTFNVNTGTFYTSAAARDLAARNAANAFLAGLAGPVTANYSTVYLEAVWTKGQDLVTVSDVPLPAAGWLMLAGLGGLAALRRRKNTA